MNIRIGGLRALTCLDVSICEKNYEPQSWVLTWDTPINKDLGQNHQGKIMKKRQSFLFMSSWERSGFY